MTSSQELVELLCPYTPPFIFLLSEAALALSPVLLGSVGLSSSQALVSFRSLQFPVHG